MNIHEVRGEVVPVRLEADFPVYNISCTTAETTVYTGLSVKEINGKKWLVAEKEYARGKVFTAPVGSVVELYYESGSRAHVYYKFHAFFEVMPVGERKVVLKNQKREGETEVRTTNLSFLEMPSEIELAEIEAEIRNIHGAFPSLFDPVKFLYYHWVKKGAKEEREKLIALIQQKRKELEELEARLKNLGGQLLEVRK